MGVEPFLIASSLVGASAALSYKLYECKEEYTAEREAKLLSIDDDIKLYRKVGCPACNDSGYKGRIAIYEILTITNELKELISAGATTGQLKEVALKNGMKTLASNCSRLVLSGVTSLEEMLSVVSIRD